MQNADGATVERMVIENRGRLQAFCTPSFHIRNDMYHQGAGIRLREIPSARRSPPGIFCS